MKYISVKGKLDQIWHYSVVDALEKTSGLKDEEEIEE